MVSNLRIFVFSLNFAIRQIWGCRFRKTRRCWIQIWQHCLQIPAPKIPKSGIFGPQFKDFYFFIKLCDKANSRTLISNMTISFSNCSPKNTQIWHFWYPTEKLLLLRKTVQVDKFEGANFKYHNLFFKKI